MIPYKDDNPTERFPYVTIAIITLNVMVFVIQSTGAAMETVYRYGAMPAALLGMNSPWQPVPASVTLLTSMFMHGGILHLGGNMLYLWIFGDNIEDRLGHLRFALFYIVGGVIAAYSHAFASWGSIIPMIGASGAVSAVLGAYLLFFPSAKVHTVIFLGFFVQVVKLPALIVIGFWAIIQMLNGLLSSGSIANGGVAWFAHLGGFLYGLTVINFFYRTNFNRRRKKWL